MNAKRGRHTQGPAHSIPKPISVFLAEATLVNCQLMEQALRRQRGTFSVAAYALPSKEVVGLLKGHEPDIAVISVNLADGPLMGFSVLRALRVLWSTTRVVMLVDQPTRELVIDVFRYGAQGLFRRNAPFSALCRGIRAVAAGQIWAENEDIHCLLQAFTATFPLRVVDAKGVAILSRREEMIVDLVAEGFTNREISASLGLSEHTVRNYVCRVYDKLGISSRVELTLYRLNHRQVVQNGEVNMAAAS